MKNMVFLSTFFTVASLSALSSDDYPMLNQETQEEQIEDQRLQNQRLQDKRLQNQRLENKRQDQRVQDRRVQEQRVQNQRRLVAESDIIQESKPNLELKDRFTTTEDRTIANLVKAKIAEVTGEPSSANNIILVVDKGDVKVVGKVSSDELRTKISQAILQIKGVKSIHNRLEISK